MGPPLPRRARAGRALRPWDARGEGPGPQPREPSRPPAPGRASPGHSPPRRWPPQCAPRPPPGPAPRAPPGLGAVTGGRGRTRRAERLEDRAGERGAAGRSGRPGVWASVAPVSRSPRGAPRPGVGRAAESAPGGGREGPRGPAGARGGAGAGQRGKGLSPWEESGASGRASELSQRSGSGRPVGARARGPVSRETRLGRLEAPLAGRLPGVRDWSWSFSNLTPVLPSQTNGSSGMVSRQCRLRTSLKVTTFCFLFCLAFPWNKIWNLAAMGRRWGPKSTRFSPSLSVSSLPPPLTPRLNHILERARSFVGWATFDCLSVYFLMCS